MSLRQLTFMHKVTRSHTGHGIVYVECLYTMCVFGSKRLHFVCAYVKMMPVNV